MSANAGSVFKRFTRSSYLGGAFLCALLISAGFYRARASSAVANPAPLSDDAVAPLVALDHATEAVEARVMPSVVIVNVVAQEQSRNDMPDMNDIPAPFRQFFGNGNGMRQMQPQIERGLGSGVIISPDGYIVTNNHVVQNATQVTVTLNDQREFKGKVVGTDPATDLAVIKIDAGGLTPAPWGDSSAMKPGDTVMAFGSPLQMSFSVTRGIVSALNRGRFGDGPDTRGVFIQTDAAINPGNSGGPLVNSYGQVIGINTEMLSSSGGYTGIGFAIPSDLVRPTADSLMRNGKVVRGYLGITVTDLTPQLARPLGDAGVKGALVNQVTPGSPADRAGLQTYDVITAFNGHAVTGSNDLQTVTGAAAPGTEAKLSVMRDGKPMTIDATLGTLPASGSAAESESSSDANATTSKLGVTASALTADDRSQLGVPASMNGVVVHQVEPGGAADNAGIAQGDLILQVNRHAVTTVEGLRQQLSTIQSGSDALLLVFRGGSTHIAVVHIQ